MKNDIFNYTNSVSHIQPISNGYQALDADPRELLACSFDEASHFLNLIAPISEIFCFRSIDPNKKSTPCNYTSALEQTFSDLEQKNIFMREGIFVVINEGDHKDASIVKIRAVFCDWDDPKTAVQLCGEASKILEPHIIVESSPGKRHAYWLVDDLPIGRFRLWQEHLIGLFNSDKAIKNESRVMRLPGFYHTKNELFMTRIIGESGKGAYSEVNLIAAFGEPEKKRKAPTPANFANSANLITEDESICIERVSSILQSAQPGTRHEARLKAGRLAGGYIAGGLVNEGHMVNRLMQLSDSIADKGVTDMSEKKALVDSIKKGKVEPIHTLYVKPPAVIDFQRSEKGNRFDVAHIQPEPLRPPLPVSEPFPVEVLGEVLAAASRALHESVQAPLALCCQSVLASATLAVQAHFDVRLPWGSKKPLSLLFLTIADSGERKSALDEIVLIPAKEQERQDMECFNDLMEAHQDNLERWKAENETAKKTAAKAKGQAARDYIAEAKHHFEQKPAEPIKPLRLISDPTVEGLYKLLVEGQPNVGMFSDEGGLLIGGHALNADNALKTMARWCKLWDGAPFDRVRAGDGCNILYGRRFCMHQMAQSDVMGKLLNDPMANNQGFLARCLVVWPESTIGHRMIQRFVSPIELNEIQRFFAVLKQLIEAKPRTGKSDQELDPIDLPLDEDAIQMAIKATNHFEKLMQKGNDLAELKDRTAKALENACRIAGVLAVIDKGMATRSISAKHLERGLILVQWYLKEALRIRGAVAIPPFVIDAESLLEWLQDRNMSMFRTAPVLTHGPNKLREKKRLKAAIDELVKNGYLVKNAPGTIVDGVKARASWRVLHYVV